MTASSRTGGNGHLLRLENVNKTFQMGEVRVDALRDVSLDIRCGELIVMVGPSGSGKTTILNLIGGLDPVTSGRLWFGDREITRFTSAELTRYRRETVGFIFQFYNLVPNLTAAENVMVATELSRDPMPVAEALRLVGLEERMSISRRSFPAASSSAWRLPGRWPRTPRSCSATSRPGPWTSPRASWCCGRSSISTASLARRSC